MFTAAKHFSVKNGRFRASGEALPDENRAAKDEVLHTRPTFVHVFCSNFATFRVSVSTPNFQKSTPNFQKALTFFLNERHFLPKSNQPADNQQFSKPSKNRRFFVQKFLSWRIFEIWRPKMAILSISFKKKKISIFSAIIGEVISTLFRKKSGNQQILSNKQVFLLHFTRFFVTLQTE